MEKSAKIYVAGHRGVAGSAVCRALSRQGYTNVITRTHDELDLTQQAVVDAFFKTEHPEYVLFFAAKRVSILQKTNHPLDACLDTIKMTVNVLDAAHRNGVRKLLLASSASAYPICKDGETRKNDTILQGPYEKTNEPYSLGKIVGAKLCEYYARQYGDEFFAVMPCVFFGPGDDFEIGRGPFVPTLIHRLHNAKVSGDSEFAVWGTGKPEREFVYAGDVADACLFLMENGHGGINYNIGNGGKMISIMDMARAIASVVGYDGCIVTDQSKPDGAKLSPLDSSHLADMGWRSSYTLLEGLEETYQYFLKNVL